MSTVIALHQPATAQTCIQACYSHSPIPAFAGNPLIEALPPIATDDALLDAMLSLPAFDPAHRELEPHLRGYLVGNLKQFFVPLDRHLELARRIDHVLRWGYANRHPETPERPRMLQGLYDEMQGGKRATVSFDKKRPICSFSLVGVSGGGKSTATELVLSMYPQLLFHAGLHQYQVVYIKADCPKDGSLRELGIGLLQAFDDVLGTDFAKQATLRMNADELLKQVKQLAFVYNLGILVIDEIQNVSVKKSGGREAMLNWFQELVNQPRIPVMLMGTMKAANLLRLDLRHARRSAGAGSLQWTPLALGSEWSGVVQSVWDFQWVRNPAPLDESMTEVLHYETQGIKALLIDMFMVSQLRAIRLGQERVTAELFKHVARHDFAPVQPMLGALRSGSPVRLSKYPDVCPYDIDDMLRMEQQMLESRGVAQQQGHRQPPGDTVSHQALAKLIAAGIAKPMAAALLEKVYDGSQKSVRALVKAALIAYAADTSFDDEGSDGDAGTANVALTGS